MRHCRRPLLVLIVLLLLFVLVLRWNGTKHENEVHFDKWINRGHKDTRREKRIRESMVLSLDYYEQTTNALRNLMDLQCWAQTVNITKVVEPSVYSLPGKAFHFSVKPNLTFRDYFDIAQWNSANFHHNSSVLVSLKYFMKNSHKRIILVQLKYSAHKHCVSLEEMANKQWFKFFVRHGFSIKTTCFLVKFPIDKDVFIKKIFLSTNNFGNASILFDQWRGISKATFRLRLSDSRCLYHSIKFSTHIHPFKVHQTNFPIAYSKRLLQYCNDFVLKHLHESKYIVVMIRTEKLDFSIVSDNNLSKSTCIQHIKADLKDARSKAKKAKVLYFTDSGIHGTSAKMYKQKKQHAAAIFSNYLENVLNPYFSAVELDKRLESITKSLDSILIAMMQSALAARADALVIAGGGSFQDMTKNMYFRTHKGPETYFSRDVHCSRQFYKHKL